MIKPFFFLITLSMICCTTKKDNSTSAKPEKTQTFKFVSIPNDTVNINQLITRGEYSQWYLGDSIYNGYAEANYTSGNKKTVIGINNGFKEGRTIEWYPSRRMRSEVYYHLGKLHGSKKTWSNDTSQILLAHLSFSKGKANGVQRKWYTTGELYLELNMKNGREEGIQRAYRKNGNLYANYEAKNGRIFGLKRAALCVEIEDEKIKTKN